MGQIILLHDLIDIKKRKQKELEFYRMELEELKAKMSYIKKEIDLTSYIIEIIEKEKVIDLYDSTK